MTMSFTARSACAVVAAASLAGALIGPAMAQDASAPTNTAATEGERLFATQVGPQEGLVWAQPSNERIYVDWLDVPGAQDYTIELFADGDPDTPVRTVNNRAASSVQLAPVDNGTTYSVVVTANLADGTTTVLEPALVTPAPLPTQPGRPRLQAYTYNTVTVSVTGNIVPAPDHPVTGYQALFTDTETGNEILAASAGPEDLDMTAQELTPFATYEVRVAALTDIDGQVAVGPYSALPLTVTPVGAPAPTGVEVVSQGNRTVTLNWNKITDFDRPVEYYYVRSTPESGHVQDYLDDMAEIAEGYQAESAEFDIALATNADGADVNYVYAWDGRHLSDPPTQAELDVAAEHAPFAAAMDAYDEFVSIYLLKASGFPAAVPAGNMVLVAEVEAGGECWADFGPAPAAGDGPVSVDCDVDVPARDVLWNRFAADSDPSTWQVRRLANGENYTFEVAAAVRLDTGQLRRGDFAEPVIGTPQSSPVPSNFRVQLPANESVYFDFDKLDDVQGYYIFTNIVDAQGIPDPKLPRPRYISNRSWELGEVVKGLSNGVKYGFRIASRQDFQIGDQSSPAITATPVAVPGIPNVGKGTVSAEEISVKITPPKPIAGVPDADRYQVTFTPEVGEEIVVDTQTTTATATGLTEGMTYAITARAGNENGYGYHDVSPLLVVAVDKPGAVIAPSVERIGDGSVAKVSWLPPFYPETGGVKEYRVDPNPVDPTDVDPPSQRVTDTTATFEGMDPAGDYTFRIFAVTDAGAGKSVIVGSLVDAPSNTQVSYDTSSGVATLTWARASDRSLAYDAQALLSPFAAGNSAALRLADASSARLAAMVGSTTVVTPTEVSCQSSSCTAVFENFDDKVGEGAWDFRVRSTDNVFSASNWISAANENPPNIAGSYQVSTQTQFTCEEGYAKVGTNCEKYAPYTYHQETREDTKNNPNGDCTDAPGYWTWTCPAGYSAGGGQWGACICKGSVTETVKDAPPAGWIDDGSRYVLRVPAQTWNTFEASNAFDSQQDMEAAGINSLEANGAPLVPGGSMSLGRCPGDVLFTAANLFGISQATENYCN